MRDGIAGWVSAHGRALLLALVVTSGVGILVALVTVQDRAARARDEALRWQSHSYEVMIRAQAVSGAVSSAEAALGRYIVSNERLLGLRYVDLWKQAGGHLDLLQREVADDPAQVLDVAKLRGAYEKRGDELAEIAGYSSFKRSMTALGLFYLRRDSPALRDMTVVLKRMIDREHALLVQRTSAAADAVAQSNAATGLLTLFGALLVVGASVLGWLNAKSVAERTAAAAEAESERERAELLTHAVEAATAELRREARERAEAEAQLRQAQKMEAVGQLTGGIAHDFNNMLAVVIGGLDLARRKLQIGGDPTRHINNAMEGANRAAALTRRLLAFSRAEPLLPEAVDAGTLIAGMSDLLDRTLGDGVTVRAVNRKPGWRIWVDRHALENALLNLAVNARDAMDGRGTLTIETDGAPLAEKEIGDCTAGDYVSIAVIDTGAGMTPDVLERVFEPFFTTKPVGKGTGLGLSQIFAFVRQSAGEIAIESAPGAGTTVMLFLPRHLAASTDPAPIAPPTPAEPRESGPFDILVVEDDPRVLAATVSALEELGHRPIACADPFQAPAAIAQSERLDLILSDVLMPGRSGPEMITALGDDIAGIAILFVTGFAGDATSAGLLGEHPVLRKPFTIASLGRAIDELMAGRGTPQASNLAAE